MDITQRLHQQGLAPLWMVTGVAGFIGSHILETLLKQGQKVVGVDNFSTTNGSNLEYLKNQLPKSQWQNFTFIKGDVGEPQIYKEHLGPQTIILHQAALASVPESMAKPELYFANNVEATRRLFEEAHRAQVKKIVFASSSAVYGDDPAPHKTEDQIGRPLSPYAENKRQNELDALEYLKISNAPHITALRYFNGFGERQDPEGAYAAVIPSWVSLLTKQKSPHVFGDGLQTRDFCHVSNIVEANLLASLNSESQNPIYNVGTGGEITLLQLFETLKAIVSARSAEVAAIDLDFQLPREGDIFQSQASIDKIQKELGYEIVCDFKSGLEKTVDWFW